MEAAFTAGTLAGAGSFRCDECGFAIALHEQDEVPACPHCHTGRFARSSLFEYQGRPDEPQETVVECPDWIAETRKALEQPGEYVAFEYEGNVRVLPLSEEWTRLGRSLSAHVRLDDPTVSRRHALIHCQEGVCRILDDRSLNGVFLNGERVDWHELEDGDEIAIGRFRIYFMSVGARASRDAEDRLTVG